MVRKYIIVIFKFLQVKLTKCEQEKKYEFFKSSFLRGEPDYLHETLVEFKRQPIDLRILF